MRKSLRRLFALAAFVLTIVLAVTPAFAAESVHLILKVDGQAVKGDSTQASLGRADTIECIALEQSVQAAEKGQYGPLKCVKRIDRATPLLVKALLDKKPVEAVFKFYRPNPSGDGTTEQFFTIELKQAKITGYRLWVASTIDPASSNMPPLEEITFTYQAISYTYSSGN